MKTAIQNRKIRKRIKSVLVSIARTSKTKEPFGLSQVDELCKLIGGCASEAVVFSDRKHSKKLETAYLAILATGCLGMALVDGGRKRPWPKGWIRRADRPNANLWLGTMVLSLSRYALSAIHLCRLGQDFSARLVIRNVIELSWLIIILADDQTKLRLHALARSEKKMIRFGPNILRLGN